MTLFSFQRPAPLIVVVLLHIAFLWALQAGLAHRHALRPVTSEISARLIPPSPLPMSEAKIEPPKPKPVTKHVTPPSPVTPRPIEIPTPNPTPSEHAISVPANPVAPAEAAPANIAASTEPAPISAPRFDAAYLNNPAPPYPSIARRMKEEGEVMLRVFVSVEGLAAEVKLHKSSGSSRLDEAAIQAVRHWRFVPAMQGDKAVAGWVTVPIVFRLDG